MNYLEKMFKSIYKQAGQDTGQDECLWRVVNQMASSTESLGSSLGISPRKIIFPMDAINLFSFALAKSRPSSPVTGVCS